MLVVWEGIFPRPTRDIDLLGRTSNDQESIRAIIRDVCSMTVEPDGMAFDPGAVDVTVIGEAAEYQGVRATVRGYLGSARVALHVDVGFGDLVTPGPKRVVYPTALAFPPPVIAGYSRESAITEKFEVMVRLGLASSRMKDIFDIWFLARSSDFAGAVLAEAIAGTFSHRGTAVDDDPVALTDVFASDSSKQAQWRAFRRRMMVADAPEELADVVALVREFLGPVVRARSTSRPFEGRWSAGGPWRVGPGRA